MVRAALLAILAAGSTAWAGAACGIGNKCSEDSPCCSQYGQCGVGAYCLGGCDPQASFSLDSCVPAPVCQSKTYTFENMDRIMSINKHLGDPSETDWVSDGEAAIYNDNILLTMPADSTGTVLASTTYMWYGNVRSRFKTSRGTGVVTAFILLSDVKDEIDFEFVGGDLENAQSNYYFQGALDYENSKKIPLSDTYENYHTYEIQWTPDEITWIVDDQPGRTQKRIDTWNSTTNQWDYPQTPARVQISVWPGGASSNAPGTVEWAGGSINWQSDLMQPQGYYYATFESITVDCFNASSGIGTNDKTSYTYKDIAGTNDTVEDGDKPTVLKSLLGTGTDMDAGESSSGSATPSTTADTVPGSDGGAPGNNNHDTDATGTGSGSGSSQTGSGGGSNGFSQGNGGSSGGKTSGAAPGENGQEVWKGSMFAGIVAVIGVIAL